MKQESKTEGDPGRLRSEERNVGNKDEVSRKQSGGYRITCKNTGILIVCVCVCPYKGCNTGEELHRADSLETAFLEGLPLLQNP